MSNKIWKIEKSVLTISSVEGVEFVPTAAEVFEVVFKGKNTIGGYELSTSLDQDFPDITFSKYPLQFKVELVGSITDGNMQISCVVIGFHKNRKLLIQNILEDGADHIIHENVWYPFAPGALQEIKTLLHDAGIKQVGRISLRQYLALKKIASSGGTFVPIEDTVLNVLKTKEEVKDNLDTSDQISYLTCELYPYQTDGYRWLKMIAAEDAGCILADEMGLGKTLQVIALLSNQTLQNKDPSLVISPATLLENWRREVARFAPEIRVLIHQGANRTGYYRDLISYDLVITSYETVLRDLSMFKMVNWNIVVLDEAQAIKNPLAKRTKAVKEVPRRVSIAVTGTPVENQLTDLWSITDFAFPGILGDYKSFNNKYSDDPESAAILEPMISPILLRRRVEEVAQDLPPRIDIPQVLVLDEKGANEYETIRQQIISDYGNNASLVSIGKLRMYCTHPNLLEEQGVLDPNSTPKYHRLIEILDEIVSSKEKAIIFTSYARMIDTLLSDLSQRYNVFCEWIDGRVPVHERQHKVDCFTEIKGAGILVLNPRAAGAGLNITAANHVIHYNLEWNPAIEDQASARAFRRGQTRPVTIHRLYYGNTIEELVNNRIESKRMLAETAVVGTNGKLQNNADIFMALRMSPVLEED